VTVGVPPPRTSALVPELPLATYARELVPGDPDDVDDLAAQCQRFAEGASDAARRVRGLTLGGWVGQAAEAFAHEIDDQPRRLEKAADAFTAAARALRLHAAELRHAQDGAAAAIRLWQDAARPPPVPVDAAAVTEDAGSADRTRAERMVLDAREAVAISDRAVNAALGDAGDAAPDRPGLLSRALHALSSFGEGAVEATVGIVEFAYRLSPAYQLIDPKGYLENLENLGKGLAYGIKHPDEFGKALLDWETWKDDPARALGHLLPDLLLALATAGGGTAVRGVETARGVERAGRTVQTIRRSVDLLKDTGEVAWRGKGLEGRGLVLEAKGNFAAEAFRLHAEEVEKSLSPRMQELMRAHGGEPMGWRYRLKDADSLKRKLATDIAKYPEEHPVDLLSGIGDNVRYTVGFDEGSYAAKTRELAESLKAQGFEQQKFKNTWAEEGYQGINSNWADPETGYVFELQFHTEASYEVKAASHDMYKEMRLPDTPMERRLELKAEQDAIFAEVPRPAGAPGLASANSPPSPPSVPHADGIGLAGPVAAAAGGQTSMTVDRLTDAEAATR
jgi:uncharacterized protein YukE